MDLLRAGKDQLHIIQRFAVLADLIHAEPGSHICDLGAVDIQRVILPLGLSVRRREHIQRHLVSILPGLFHLVGVGIPIGVVFGQAHVLHFPPIFIGAPGKHVGIFPGDILSVLLQLQRKGAGTEIQSLAGISLPLLRHRKPGGDQGVGDGSGKSAVRHSALFIAGRVAAVETAALRHLAAVRIQFHGIVGIGLSIRGLCRKPGQNPTCAGTALSCAGNGQDIIPTVCRCQLFDSIRTVFAVDPEADRPIAAGKIPGVKGVVAVVPDLGHLQPGGSDAVGEHCHLREKLLRDRSAAKASGIRVHGSAAHRSLHRPVAQLCVGSILHNAHRKVLENSTPTAIGQRPDKITLIEIAVAVGIHFGIPETAEEGECILPCTVRSHRNLQLHFHGRKRNVIQQRVPIFIRPVLPHLQRSAQIIAEMHSAAAYGIAIRRSRFLNGIRPGQAIGGILIQIGNFEAPAVFLNRGCEAHLVACQGAGHVDDSLFQRNCGSSTPRVQCDLRDLFPAGHSRYMAVKTQRQRIWPGAEGIAEIVPGLAACHAGLLQTGIVIAIGHRGRSILLGLGIQAETVGIPVFVGDHPHTVQGCPVFCPFADLNGG